MNTYKVQMNGRPVEVLRQGATVVIPWRDVRCGDVVKVRRGGSVARWLQYT